MIIKNGKVFGENGQFAAGVIVIEGDKISRIINDNGVMCKGEIDRLPEDLTVFDAAGCYVIPGMVDIHLHGCAGYDFCDGTAEAFDAIIKYQLNHGITSICPTTMTLDGERIAGVLESIAKYDKNVGKIIKGITLEGPFIARAKKGAQKEENICKPDIALFGKLQKAAGGRIRQIVVAPEEDSEFAFTKAVCKDAVVSLGHTAADYDIANAAFGAGATHVTHLYNAMPAFHHREPGVVGAAYDNEKVFVELICDGVHVHPSMVRAMFALFGAERICMISDSMMATGLQDGGYSLGGQAVKVKGKKAVLADGTIAGSVTNLHDCLKIAVQQMAIPLEEAVRSCTLTPARSLGLEGECGSISVGKAADLVVVDAELNVRLVVKDGKIL